MPYDAFGNFYHDAEQGDRNEQASIPQRPAQGYDPRYQGLADLYRPDLARLRQQNDARLAAYGQVDENGPMADYLPPTEIAPDVQFRHDRAVADYNSRLARDAFGVYQRGLENFQTYRPGGAASLASGMYQGMAQSILAGQRDPLDLMYNARADEAFRARQKARRAGVGQAVGTVAGAAIGSFGGPAGAIAGASIGGALGTMVAGGGPGQVPAGAASTFANQAQQPQGDQQQPEQPANTTGQPGTPGGGPLLPSAGGAQAPGVQPNAVGGASANVNAQGANGGGGTKSVGGGYGGEGGGAMGQAGGMHPSMAPSGMGRMGFNTGAVADTYEMRYGEPADVTFANYYAHEGVGFADRMLDRLDMMMFEVTRGG